MPEHLRSLIVILAIATVVFAFWKSPAASLLSTPGEFERRRNLWFGITLAAFLTHNFWVFILVSGIMLYLASQRDENKVGLIFFVVLAIPLFKVEIPGFAGIRYLFDMEFFRLLSLAVMLPYFISQLSKNNWSYFSNALPDKFLYSYLALNILLAFFAGTLTGTTRNLFVFFIDIVIPYAIVSRGCNNTAILKSAIASYVIGATIMACIGIIEFSKSWLLYSTLDDALGAQWGYGSYLKRDENLRAAGTAGQAIPYGYTMAIGICLMLGLRQFIKSKLFWFSGLALLTLGMISSYSRGPWVGAIVGLLVFMLTGRELAKNIARLIGAAILLAIVAVVTPLGEKIFESITVESYSYEYRQRVFEVSMGVIIDHPLFGAWDSLYAPAMQELKQGQGIIDIVNSYIAIGLRSGFTGIILFSAFFATACFGIWKKIREENKEGIPETDLGRSLLAALTCALTTIATVSSITFVPIMYYLLAALAVGYVKITHEKSDRAAESAKTVIRSGLRPVA